MVLIVIQSIQSVLPSKGRGESSRKFEKFRERRFEKVRETWGRFEKVRKSMNKYEKAS